MKTAEKILENKRELLLQNINILNNNLNVKLHEICYAGNSPLAPDTYIYLHDNKVTIYTYDNRDTINKPHIWGSDFDIYCNKKYGEDHYTVEINMPSVNFNPHNYNDMGNNNRVLNCAAVIKNWDRIKTQIIEFIEAQKLLIDDHNRQTEFAYNKTI